MGSTFNSLGVSALKSGDLVLVNLSSVKLVGLVVSVRHVELFDNDIQKYSVYQVFAENGLVLYHEEDLEIIGCYQDPKPDGSPKGETS